MEEERFDPRVDSREACRADPWWGIHAARYVWADTELRSARMILEAACGTGYGMSILGRRRIVIGVDVVPEALRRARGYGGVVTAADCSELPFRSGTFDAVTTFETIEHLHDRRDFVTELARVLRPNGMLLLSTPNALHTKPQSSGPSNPFHVHEYEPGELVDELSPFFEDIVVFGQSLSARFRISPFEEDQLTMPRDFWTQARLLAWRATNKLPAPIREGLCRITTGHPFYPGERDYDFDEQLVMTAPVLVVKARVA